MKCFILSIVYSTTQITTSISESPIGMHKIGKILVRFPLSLHATWMAAACLLNLNGWATVSMRSIAFQASLAIASAYFASILGTVMSLCTVMITRISHVLISFQVEIIIIMRFNQADIFIAATVAWTLFAIAVEVKQQKKSSSAQKIAARDIKETIAFTSSGLAYLALLSLPVIAFSHRHMLWW